MFNTKVAFLDRLWYGKHPLHWGLLPFSWIYTGISFIRRYYLKRFKQQQFPVPIIVVGNLTVGGTGKTPLVIEIATWLQAKGIRVGIVTRGYTAKIKHFPFEVREDSTADLVGDEPLLLAKRTACPVVIAPSRVAAVHYLLAHHQSQIIISDDGLQHYTMGRALEIVMVDGERGLGNGHCLPAGPLRENANRLRTADFIVVNGETLKAPIPGLTRKSSYFMHLLPHSLVHIQSGKPFAMASLTPPMAAIAGIGNPQRFFLTLKRLGLSFNAYAYRDHYRFQAHDLNVPETTIIMTEKDAVKCHPFATNSMYFLRVTAKMDEEFWRRLSEKITVWLNQSSAEVATKTPQEVAR